MCHERWALQDVIKREVFFTFINKNDTMVDYKTTSDPLSCLAFI